MAKLKSCLEFAAIFRGVRLIITGREAKYMSRWSRSMKNMPTGRPSQAIFKKNVSAICSL